MTGDGTMSAAWSAERKTTPRQGLLASALTASEAYSPLNPTSPDVYFWRLTERWGAFDYTRIIMYLDERLNPYYGVYADGYGLFAESPDTQDPSSVVLMPPNWRSI